MTTTYAYDALNRLTSKTYSDSTPSAQFFYDQAPSSMPAWTGVAFSKATGRLVLTCTNSAAGTCTSPQTATAHSYESMGRVRTPSAHTRIVVIGQIPGWAKAGLVRADTVEKGILRGSRSVS